MVIMDEVAALKDEPGMKEVLAWWDATTNKEGYTMACTDHIISPAT